MPEAAQGALPNGPDELETTSSNFFKEVQFICDDEAKQEKVRECLKILVIASCEAHHGSTKRDNKILCVYC